jgi:hypothetical protein
MSDITETVLDPRQAPTQHVVVLQALHGAPQRVARLVGGLPSAAHDWRPAPEAWSARMTVAHLAGAEGLFLGRVRAVLSEANPFLPNFGPARARPDGPGNVPELLARFEQERAALVRLLVDLRPADWERTAVHEAMGPTTLALQIHNIANHDTDHVEQLAALVSAWERRPHD